MNTTVNLNDCVMDMMKCEQTSGQSVFQHGQSVKNHLLDLIHYLRNGKSDYEWKLPDCIQTFKNQILDNLYDNDTLQAYAVFHDIGKPYTRIVDEAGKVHFPDHAEISRQKWLETGGSELVANLIGWDMDIHTLSSDEIAQRCKEEWSVEDACTLVLTSLAELHSNARMFGGTGSIGFKQKFKQIERRSKQICKFYF